MMASINRTLEEYVLDMKEIFKDNLFTTAYYKSDTDSNSYPINKRIIKDTVTNPWMSIVSSYFKDLNLTDDFKYKICLYCELVKRYQESMSIGAITSRYVENDFINVIKLKLSRLRDTLSSKKVRSKIIDKYYNYTDGKVEYLLEDGTFIEINESITKPKNDFDISLLPTEVLCIIDDTEYRNRKIEDII